MKAYSRQYSTYVYTVEMNRDIIIPTEIRKWLILKDSPFDYSHVEYISIDSNIIAFEYADDAYYFIAYMEHLGADYLVQ